MQFQSLSLLLPLEVFLYQYLAEPFHRTGKSKVNQRLGSFWILDNNVSTMSVFREGITKGIILISNRPITSLVEDWIELIPKSIMNFNLL
jgi:hypothetical protein